MRNKTSDNAVFEVSLKFVVRDMDNRILLLTMPDLDQMAGYFDLPGGRIKESEKTKSFKNILSRELMEELGLKVRLDIKETPVAIGRHSYSAKDTGETKWIFWILFEALYKGGEIQISSEHQSYIWGEVNTENLSKLFIKGSLEVMSNYLTGVLS
jgi:8-oxo-dGTP pyrophosphatase MutT (NUDIX family)